MTIYNASELKIFAQNIFKSLKVNEDHASITADALIRANLEGVDSHGISRLAIYANRIKDQRIKSNPSISINKQGESLLMVDGDNGLGQVVSFTAISEGIKVAQKTGIVAIGIRNSNHFGSASYFCQMACERNIGAIAFTNSPSAIPPWGGTKAFFGTNPIAFGFPTGTDKPVIIDMSTSVVARGKIILAAKQNESIPNGWAIDKNGIETNDAREALKGAVLPVGGAKGYALALAVEILTGILTGAAFGPYVNNIYDDSATNANVGHFFILFDIEKFMPVDQYTTIMNIFLNEIKNTPKQPDVEEILYPGERRGREYQKRKKEGIDLSEEVESELVLLARDNGVEFPKEANK